MSYRIVADITDGWRADAVAIMRALEDAAHARGVAITVYGPLDLAAGGVADAGETAWVPGVGHPATGEPFGNYVARMRREADPPMGYGFRQDHETRELYAIRWGQSGRITGAIPIPETSRAAIVAHLAEPGPAAIRWDEPGVGVEMVTWAQGRRWEPVTA